MITFEFDGSDPKLERHVDPKAPNNERRKAYSVTDLVELCTNTLSEDDPEKWTKDRKAALKELREWRQSLPDKCKVPYHDHANDKYRVPTKSEMNKGLKLISRLCFGGSLTRVYVDWQPFMWLDSNGKEQEDGCYAHTVELARDSGRIRIAIDPAPNPIYQDVENASRGFINSLVHESIHGYLAEYCCASQTCHCYNDAPQALGLSGHGPAFLEILTHMRRFWRTHLPEHITNPDQTLFCLETALMEEFQVSGHALDKYECVIGPDNEDRVLLFDFAGQCTKINEIIGAKFLDVTGIEVEAMTPEEREEFIGEFAKFRGHAIKKGRHHSWTNGLDDLEWPAGSPSIAWLHEFSKRESVRFRCNQSGRPSTPKSSSTSPPKQSSTSTSKGTRGVSKKKSKKKQEYKPPPGREWRGPDVRPRKSSPGELSPASERRRSPRNKKAA